MELRGRAALVTGAGRRVGRALAIALGEQGMRVGVHYGRSEREAEETAREIEKVGGTAVVIGADLTEPGATGHVIDQAVSSFGSLDVLVNSAAVMQRTPVGTVTVADWDAMFALNLRAPFFLAQAAAPHLARTRGAVVNIADLAAFETWPGYVPHSITKAGVVQMTRALARVLAPDVRVNAIAPGAVLLPDGWSDAEAEHLRESTPLRRLGSPADVVSAMLFLLRAEYVTGEVVIVDGGRHVRR
jgi:pteridine reductase